MADIDRRGAQPSLEPRRPRDLLRPRRVADGGAGERGGWNAAARDAGRALPEPRVRRYPRRWDVHPDGKRFLIAEEDETEALPSSIHIIENWPALLREKGAR